MAARRRMEKNDKKVKVWPLQTMFSSQKVLDETSIYNGQGQV